MPLYRQNTHNISRCIIVSFPPPVKRGKSPKPHEFLMAPICPAAVSAASSCSVTGHGPSPGASYSHLLARGAVRSQIHCRVQLLRCRAADAHRHRRRMAAAALPPDRTAPAATSLQSPSGRGGSSRHVPRARRRQHLRGRAGPPLPSSPVCNRTACPAERPGAYGSPAAPPAWQSRSGLHRRRPDAVPRRCRPPRIVLEHRRFHAAAAPAAAAGGGRAPAPQQALPRRQHPERHAADESPASAPCRRPCRI